MSAVRLDAVLRRHQRLAPRAPGRRRVLLAVAAAATAALLLGVGWLWLRDSSLVAVERVTVSGLTGPQAPAVRSALEGAAMEMTTLHVREDQLRTAVQIYPIVDGLRVTTDGRHGLRIRVLEHVPMAAVSVDGVRTAIGADGTILRGVTAGRDITTIPLDVPPGGDRITNPRALRAVALLAAAPPRLRARVARVTGTRDGLVAILDDGPKLIFGDAERLRAKWRAAASVLADEDAAGATYLDLSVPGRVFAGGVEQPLAAGAAGETAGAAPPGGVGGAAGATGVTGATGQGAGAQAGAQTGDQAPGNPASAPSATP